MKVIEEEMTERVTQQGTRMELIDQAKPWMPLSPLSVVHASPFLLFGQF